jgi:sigma-B regulation protein RsbU (phosphoserine phosphatase)
MTMMLPISQSLNAARRLSGNAPMPETAFSFVERSRRNSLSPADESTSSVAADVLALSRELDDVRLQHAKLQQAIYEAAQIQRRLCAPRELVWGEFEIAGESFAVRHLSGDFFKVMELDAVLGVALGDIAGKGLSAGIWQAHMMDLIQRCARAHRHPADAVAAINRELCRDQNEPPITALFFAHLDPLRNELVYCSAGLPAPLLLRRDKSVDRLEAGGPMLGALQDASYEVGTVQLHPGDMLLAYSDGLTECRDAQDQEFEMARLTAAAKNSVGTSANQVLFATLGTVLDFANGCTPGDDLTLLVIRRSESSLEDSLLDDNDFLTPRHDLPTAARPGSMAGGPKAIFNS